MSTELDRDKGTPHRRARRVPGRSFAIGFGLFLVIGTAVFTFLARQAQISREAAFDRMQEDGVVSGTAGASSARSARPAD